jgi:hypothetical protein
VGLRFMPWLLCPCTKGHQYPQTVWTSALAVARTAARSLCDCTVTANSVSKSSRIRMWERSMRGEDGKRKEIEVSKA